MIKTAPYIITAIFGVFFVKTISLGQENILMTANLAYASGSLYISTVVFFLIHVFVLTRKSTRFISRKFNYERLLKLSWQQFEEMTSEYFLLQGFKSRVVGGGGSDGGIDVIIEKNGRSYIVQCKHWKTKKVGVQIVREMYGLVHANNASGAKIVSTLGYSKQAYEFAKGKPIELITGKQIIEETSSSRN